MFLIQIDTNGSYKQYKKNNTRIQKNQATEFGTLYQTTKMSEDLSNKLEKTFLRVLNH